jgi:hypothetical protein
METFDSVRDLWQRQSATQTAPLTLNKTEFDTIIKSRIKKEKKVVVEYFWVALAFQIFIYSIGCFLIAKFWNDTRIVMLSAAGILLYLPFTIVLMRKFKAMYPSRKNNADTIRNNVKTQHESLLRFFNFKKRFDLAAIPVNCLILVGVLFQLYVPGGAEGNLFWSITGFIVMMLIFAIAAWFENRKHFIRPLRQFEQILDDMDKNI